jgi:hypothetical protein
VPALESLLWSLVLLDLELSHRLALESLLWELVLPDL